jgi:hypothetical protein
MSSSETEDDVVEVQLPYHQRRDDPAAEADVEDELELTDIDSEEGSNVTSLRNEDNHDRRGQQQRVQGSAARTTWEVVTILTGDGKRAMNTVEVNRMLDAEKASSDTWREYRSTGATANFSGFFLRVFAELLEKERVRAPNRSGHLAPLVRSQEFISFRARRTMGRKAEPNQTAITLGWWLTKAEAASLEMSTNLGLNPTLMKLRLRFATGATSADGRLIEVKWNKRYIPNCGEEKFESFSCQANVAGLARVVAASSFTYGTDVATKEADELDQGATESNRRGVTVRVTSEGCDRVLSSEEINAILDSRKSSSRTWKGFLDTGSTSPRFLSQFICEEISKFLASERLRVTNNAGVLAPLVRASDFRRRVSEERPLQRLKHNNRILLGWWNERPEPQFLGATDMRLCVTMDRDNKLRAITWNRMFLTDAGEAAFESFQPTASSLSRATRSISDPSHTGRCYCRQPICEAIYDKIRTSGLPSDHPYRSGIKQYKASDSANSIALLLSIALRLGTEYKRSAYLHSHHWPEALLLTHSTRTKPLEEKEVKELYGEDAELLLSDVGQENCLQRLSQHVELKGKAFRGPVNEALTAGRRLYTQAPVNCLDRLASRFGTHGGAACLRDDRARLTFLPFFASIRSVRARGATWQAWVGRKWTEDAK